jgi:hypothetical protein
MLQTDAEKAQIYDAIFAYSFEFIEPKLSGTCLMIWKLIEPVLKKGNINYINGSKPKKKAKPKRNRSETEANNKPNVSEVEAYKDKDKEKDKDKDEDIDIYIPSASPPVASKTKPKGKHLFKNSPYFDLEAFSEAFKSTPCFARHPALDIELIHDMMVNSEAKGYMYTNWIQAAANWVSSKPHKYTKSVKSAIQKDPAFALMTKGDLARAEHEAKMALQRKLINNGNDPYSY